MSTTSELDVALCYASGGQASLIFKLHTATFMERGVSIAFLSAFPAEAEVLFPPLTYLRPSGRTLSKRVGDLDVTVIEVVPVLS